MTKTMTTEELRGKVFNLCMHMDSSIEIVEAMEEAEDFNDFEEIITNQINELEIIYYSNAIAYLADNDPSLTESFDIASEYGYDVKDLNSEILATLLLQRKNLDMFYEVRDELEELFEEVYNENLYRR